MNDYQNTLSCLQLHLKEEKEVLDSVLKEREDVNLEKENCEREIGRIRKKIDTLKERKDILENYKSIFWNKNKLFLGFYVFSEFCIGVLSFRFVPSHITSWINFLLLTGLNFWLCQKDVNNQIRKEKYVKKHFSLKDVEDGMKKNESDLGILNQKREDLNTRLDSVIKQEEEIKLDVWKTTQELNECMSLYRQAIQESIHHPMISAYQREIKELGCRYQQELDVLIRSEYEKQFMKLKLISERKNIK